MKIGSRGIGDDEEPTPLFITEQVKWTLLLFTLTTVTLQDAAAVVLIGTSGSSDLDEKEGVTTTSARDTSAIRIWVEVYDASVTLYGFF
jgi:hypothetical protein